MRDGEPRKGAVIKLFGVALVLIGTLDSMLFWRAGMPFGGVYVLLIVAGIILFAFGTIRGATAPGRKAR